jgi:hypothetical protein
LAISHKKISNLALERIERTKNTPEEGFYFK